MTDPFVGEIRALGFNFAPRGWAKCEGQLLPISQNTALFSLLGTMYGGNGQTTFGLPDLRGRVAMHSGQGPGLSDRVQGEASGSEAVTLITAQLPAHSHAIASTAGDQTTDRPGPSAGFAKGGAYATAADATLETAMGTTAVGGSQPHPNLQPYLVLNYCIALQGIFPSRN